jgi:hypothetical protein
MAKKRSFVPGILFSSPTPQPTTVVGGGTGQGTPDGPVACNYEQWLNEYAVDLNEDGKRNGTDYRLWLQQNFPEDFDELWELFGPTVPDDPAPAPIILPDPTIIPTVEPSIEP